MPWCFIHLNYPPVQIHNTKHEMLLQKAVLVLKMGGITDNCEQPEVTSASHHIHKFPIQNGSSGKARILVLTRSKLQQQRFCCPRCPLALQKGRVQSSPSIATFLTYITIFPAVKSQTFCNKVSQLKSPFHSVLSVTMLS